MTDIEMNVSKQKEDSIVISNNKPNNLNNYNNDAIMDVEKTGPLVAEEEIKDDDKISKAVDYKCEENTDDISQEILRKKVSSEDGAATNNCNIEDKTHLKVDNVTEDEADVSEIVKNDVIKPRDDVANSTTPNDDCVKDANAEIPIPINEKDLQTSNLIIYQPTEELSSSNPSTERDVIEKSDVVKESLSASEIVTEMEVDNSLNSDKDTSPRTMDSPNSVLVNGDIIQNSDAVNLKINSSDESKSGKIDKCSTEDAGKENLGSCEDVKSPLQGKVEEKENETESNMKNDRLSIRKDSSDHPNPSSAEDPLKSLHDAINKHIMDISVKKEEDIFIDSSRDFENKELTTNQDSVPEQKSHDPRSSGESDSDEQSLRIAEENVTPSQPVIVNVVSKKDNNKSKRKLSETDKPSACENPSKKLCKELEETFEQHDAMIADYLKNTSNSSIEEIDKHTEALELEIETLKDLAQAKENEWNNMIHLRKVKEEILSRLIRKKKIILLERVNHDINECKKQLSGASKPFTSSTTPNIVHDKCEDSHPLPSTQASLSGVSRYITSSSVSIPITTSQFCHIPPMPNYQLPLDKNMHYYGNKKIVPKPPGMSQAKILERNGQLENYMMPMGRQGPIKDVKSIIADYRNRHPEAAPRRGRRLRSIMNQHSPQIAIRPRPMGPLSDSPMDLGMFLSRMENNLHLSTGDSLSSPYGGPGPHVPSPIPNGMSFKDVLVQYANMSGLGQSGTNGPVSNLPPPPPYPEVTLHPVGNSIGGVKVTPLPQPQISSTPPQQQHMVQMPNVSQQQNSSLLHGYLTKQQPKQQDNRFSTFSPTLARLLTAPEKNNPSPNTPTSSGYTMQKNSMEITITPVPTAHQSSSSRTEPEIVHLDDYEDPDQEEDSAERPLVIDEEGIDKDNGTVEINETEVPECQGCHKREAQFVCAGCANQWYCSRECQVAAWDEHSEMCSG